MATVIVGGGITGLSAAWAAAERGDQQVTLIEPGAFGGLLRTENIDGCTVECGADSWIRTKPWLRDLAAALGLADQVIACNDAMRGTWIVKNGKLTPLPKGLRVTAPTELRPILASRLIGWKTKLRMGRELFRRPAIRDDRSVAEFVRDHFGDEAVEYLAEPLFAGVYGGRPEELGAAGVLPKLVEYERGFGSVIRGARRERAVTGPLFESMRDGLGQIPSAIVRQIEGRARMVRAPAEAVEPGRVRVAGEWMEAANVVLACGAPAAGKLLAGTEAGGLLAGIPHSSATIFAFGFRGSELGEAARGFGFLVPRRERRIIMGATWVTNKFPQRAPAGVTLVRCFASKDCTESALPEIRADLQRITGITAEPLFSRVYRWPQSMPQYGVGHARLIAEIEARLPAGVRAAGAFLRGVGMPDCVKSGMEAAGR